MRPQAFTSDDKIPLIHSQVDNYITRPISCDGVPDSGVSDGSENIFSSDIDNTSLAAPQSQTVTYFV